MKKRDVERALRGMAAQETPEVLGQILRTLGKEQSMELTLKKDPVIRMPDEQERAARRGGRTGGKTMVKRMGALAAAVALVLAFGAAYLQFSVDSVIDIDVNPSVEIRINRGEKVLSAKALNEDAETVLRGMDLRNVDLNVAVNAIIGSMLKNGYLTSAGNAICVSVENENAARGEALGQKLTEEINSLLEGSSVTGRVLTRTLEENDELAELARANGISAGKAALAQLAVEQSGGSLTFEAAAALSVRELWAAAYPEDAVFLSLGDARAAALEAAGLQAEETVFAAGHLYRKEDRYVYELKLLTAEAKYYCLVDALDGQVLELAHDPLEQNTLPAPGSVIGGEEALAAACADAGVRTAAATVTKCKLDTDDGRWIYEVEFRAGGMEYEYEIDAQSGAVLERESDPEKSAPAAADVIGQEKALAAACADAGVQTSGVTLKKCRLDTDDGRWIYEVEFKISRDEYEYKIDAQSGTVLEREIDLEEKSASTSGSTNSGTASVIGQEKALAAACADAGVQVSGVTLKKCELDTDDGRQVYKIEFQVGKDEYEYKIDARSGAVLEREIDLDEKSGSTSGSANGGTASVIGQEKALAAACADAGVQASGVTLKKCKLDTDDGRQVYEIEFKAGQSEYEYKIDAQSGAVLRSENHRHDDR